MTTLLACLSLVAAADTVTLKVAAANPLLLQGKKQTTYVKVAITGLDGGARSARPPVNLSVVIDQSGSMAGDKIERAKEAAMMVVDRLSPDDILSVVAYDSTVTLLVPATRLDDRQEIKARIRELSARGSTALFAGVSAGLAEVRRNLEATYVNRVILLSDGQANVGPSSPNELGRLGFSAGKEGIAITTIGLGLGYNEDLMSQLALKSDGSHAFAEGSGELARLFDAELGDVLNVAAQDIEVRIRFGSGVRPVRALNRDCEIAGAVAVFRLNQVYRKQEKYVLFEVDVDPTSDRTRELAEVNLRIGKDKRAGAAKAALQFVTSAGEVDRAADRDVMVAVAESIAVEKNRLALDLRDQGKVQEAKQALEQNSRYLDGYGDRLGSQKLKDLGKRQRDSATNLQDEASWNRTRKAMRKEQIEIMNQQRY